MHTYNDLNSKYLPGKVETVGEEVLKLPKPGQRKISGNVISHLARGDFQKDRGYIGFCHLRIISL